MGSSESNPPPTGGILIPLEPTSWFRREFYLIGRDRTTVGRGSDCDININHPHVSRVHFSLSWVAGELRLAHESPLNPTLLNGLPVAGFAALRTGDRIEIADGVALRVELFDRASDDMPTEPRRYGDHRLAAIVHADVVSYSRLVEDDVAATARQFETALGVIRMESEAQGGHVENVAGDAVLVYFGSCASALRAATAWQRKMKTLNQDLPPVRRMEFRVGIDAGDVLVSPIGNLYGDAVNVAARLQALASPGGILVSDAVREQAQGEADFVFEPFQSNELKNISREVQIFRLLEP